YRSPQTRELRISRHAVTEQEGQRSSALFQSTDLCFQNVRRGTGHDRINPLREFRVPRQRHASLTVPVAADATVAIALGDVFWAEQTDRPHHARLQRQRAHFSPVVGGSVAQDQVSW